MKKKLMNKLKSKLNIFLLIFITLVVLYCSLKDHYEVIIKQILNLNPYWFTASIFLVIFCWILRTIVMKDLVSDFHPRYTFKKALKIILSTQFFNAVTPFASGGQPFQIYTLNKQGLKISEASNVTIQYSIIYQIALVLLGLIAISINYFCHFFPEITFLKTLTLIGFVINFFVIVGLFILTFAKRINHFLLSIAIKVLDKFKVIKDKEKVIHDWNEHLNEFHNGAKILLQDKKKFCINIFYHFLSLICLYLVPLFLVYSLGKFNNFDAVISITTCAYVMLIGSFVPIPGGTGGLEYSFVQFFKNFITGATLSSVLLLWRFLTYYFGMIIGAIAVNIKGRD